MWDWQSDSRLLLSGFQAIMTLTLTLDRVIWHAVVHHSLTSIYTPNFVEIRKTFCGWTNCKDPSKIKVTWHKLGQISKIWPDQIYILCSSLRISGHLPAPTVNVGERLGKVQFSELQKPRELTWPCIRSYGIPSSISIYIPNFIEIGRTFCGRM